MRHMTEEEFIRREAGLQADGAVSETKRKRSRSQSTPKKRQDTKPVKPSAEAPRPVVQTVAIQDIAGLSDIEGAIYTEQAAEELLVDFDEFLDLWA